MSPDSFIFIPYENAPERSLAIFVAGVPYLFTLVVGSLALHILLQPVFHKRDFLFCHFVSALLNLLSDEPDNFLLLFYTFVIQRYPDYLAVICWLIYSTITTTTLAMFTVRIFMLLGFVCCLFMTGKIVLCVHAQLIRHVPSTTGLACP